MGSDGPGGAMQPADPVRTSMLSKALVFLVLVYRASLGRLLGGQCRYSPSCSQYMIDAIGKYGAVRGTWRGVKRISRCHPWGGSGYDPA